MGLVSQIERVFGAASHKKVWDHFTKAQRKNIDLWKKQSLVCTKTPNSFPLFWFSFHSFSFAFVNLIPLLVSSESHDHLVLVSIDLSLEFSY